MMTSRLDHDLSSHNITGIKLTNLPELVLKKIIRYLDVVNLRSLKATCKKLYYVINASKSSHIKYRIHEIPQQICLPPSIPYDAEFLNDDLPALQNVSWLSLHENEVYGIYKYVDYHPEYDNGCEFRDIVWYNVANKTHGRLHVHIVEDYDDGWTILSTSRTIFASEKAKKVFIDMETKSTLRITYSIFWHPEIAAPYISRRDKTIYQFWDRNGDVYIHPLYRTRVKWNVHKAMRRWQNYSELYLYDINLYKDEYLFALNYDGQDVFRIAVFKLIYLKPTRPQFFRIISPQIEILRDYFYSFNDLTFFMGNISGLTNVDLDTILYSLKSFKAFFDTLIVEGIIPSHRAKYQRQKELKLIKKLADDVLIKVPEFQTRPYTSYFACNKYMQYENKLLYRFTESDLSEAFKVLEVLNLPKWDQCILLKQD